MNPHCGESANSKCRRPSSAREDLVLDTAVHSRCADYAFGLSPPRAGGKKKLHRSRPRGIHTRRDRFTHAENLKAFR